MKRIRYTKFTGDLAGNVDLEDLMQALSDFLLDSGFQDPYAQFSEQNNQTMEDLREAIREALESGELFDEESQQKFEELSAEQVEELVDRIIEMRGDQSCIGILAKCRCKSAFKAGFSAKSCNRRAAAMLLGGSECIALG